MKHIFFLSVVAGLVSLSLNGIARAEQVSSTLSCSAVSTNPEYKKFTLTLPFVVADNLLTAERSTISRPGKEVYSGTIDANRTVKITGHGGYYNDDDTWQYGFSGSLRSGDIVVLNGSLDTKKGAHRDCTLTFLLVTDKLLAAASKRTVANQTANNSQETVRNLPEKPKTLQSPQNELNKQRAAASSDQLSIEEYIVAHGGCAAFSNSWEMAFGGLEKAAPYGKPFLDWNQNDFSVLRKWVGRCLNPWLIQRGMQEQTLQQTYDTRVRTYQKEQERARTEIRRQEKLAAGQDAAIQSLIVQYESLRTQTQKAIQDLDAKANPFFDQTKNLQLTSIDNVIETGQEVASLGAKAQASYSETSRAVSNLTRFAENANLPGGLHSKNTEFDQLHGMFQHIQTVNARVQNVLERVQRLKSRLQPCSQRLLNSGVPTSIIETQLLTLEGENDSYLFELICPPNNVPLAYYGPSKIPGVVQFKLGNTPVSLWFDLRDDDGSKTWSKEVNGDPTPTSRLILRRVKSGSTDLSAKANWESVNLLNEASLLLAMSALQ